MSIQKNHIITRYTTEADNGDYFLYKIDDVFYEPIILKYGFNYVLLADSGNEVPRDTEIYYMKNDNEMISLGTVDETRIRMGVGKSNILDKERNDLGSTRTVRLYMKQNGGRGKRTRRGKRIRRNKIRGKKTMRNRRQRTIHRY